MPPICALEAKLLVTMAINKNIRFNGPVILTLINANCTRLFESPVFCFHRGLWRGMLRFLFAPRRSEGVLRTNRKSERVTAAKKVRQRLSARFIVGQKNNPGFFGRGYASLFLIPFYWIFTRSVTVAIFIKYSFLPGTLAVLACIL